MIAFLLPRLHSILPYFITYASEVFVPFGGSAWPPSLTEVRLLHFFNLYFIVILKSNQRNPTFLLDTVLYPLVYSVVTNIRILGVYIS